MSAASSSSAEGPSNAAVPRPVPAADRLWCMEKNYGFPIPDGLQVEFKKWHDFNADKIDKMRGRWMDYLTSEDINKFRTGQSDLPIALKWLARKGLPPELRGKIWMVLSGASARRDRSSGVYKALLVQYGSMESEATRDIQKDIDRTFPQHPLFNKTSEDRSGVEALSRVLRMVAWRNQEVGYCQSMALYAAILLMHLSEEDAFHTLESIMQTLLPRDLFQMTGLLVELEVFRSLMNARAPKLAKHFEKIGTDVAHFGTSWFLTLFTGPMPIETALRVWDAFFLEGYKVYFRVSLAILQMYEKELLEAEDPGQVMMLLQSKCKSMFDCRGLIKAAFSLRRFSRNDIDEYRLHARIKIASSS